MPQNVVGFIGLGVMGGPMAANLVKAGIEVAGFDPDPARRAIAETAGIRLVGTCADAAREATRTVVIIVRDWPQMQAAIYGEGGFAEGAHEGIDLVVMSTIEPSSVRRLAEDLAARGMSVVDAPVSGGSVGAEAGTLSIMTSGSAEALKRVRPLLDAMGKEIFVMGDQPGMGQAAKLANAVMLTANMLGAYEGLRIATANGIDEGQLMELITASRGTSWVSQNWKAVRGFWEGYVPGKELDLISKDLRCAMNEADEKRISLPVTAVAHQRIRYVWGVAEETLK